MVFLRATFIIFALTIFFSLSCSDARELLRSEPNHRILTLRSDPSSGGSGHDNLQPPPAEPNYRILRSGPSTRGSGHDFPTPPPPPTELDHRVLRSGPSNRGVHDIVPPPPPTGQSSPSD